MERKLDIPLHGPSLNIVRRCGKALSDVLHGKFGCVATFDGVDFESHHPSVAQQKTVGPEERFSVTLKSGVTVSVWRGDLIDFPVESVVNAANTRLGHYGGLAQALSKAGGPQIQQESDNYIKTHGALKTGQAVVTGAGSLRYKMIIHAVGPDLNTHNPDVRKAEPLLKEAIRSILDQVEKNHLKTVAIPAISSGIFNYPLPQCAETIVSAVKSYYDKPFSQYYPNEIFLVNNDEPTVREMERACSQILGSSMSMSHSQAAGSRSTGAAKTSTPTVKIGNVTVTLKKGNIEEQQTDVIVNTTASYRSLDSGIISKALLEKAGPGLKKEMNTASRNGYVITTKGYNLKCKQVYHTCCCENRQSRQQELLQVLYKSVLECLLTAAANHHKSIVFPAIGTGGLGLNKKDVAFKMSEAVADFAQNTQKMMEVNFVIFPSDKDTYEAFERQIRSLQQKASNPNFTHAPEHRDDSHDMRPQTPQISLNSPSDEALHEAKRWLWNIFTPSHSVRIFNNFIQHFGEEEYLQLTRLTKSGVSIEESFEKGHASISVKGDSHEDVAVAAMQVEAMLCYIKGGFVKDEDDHMSLLSNKKVSFERKKVNHTVPLFSDKLSAFKQRLQVLKVEKVENSVLETLFNMKKEQIKCQSSQQMFQRVPAQFCEMVSHIGFHAECAPPKEPKYGEGIYFAKTVEAAMELWEEQNEEYLYFVEADVLTGKSTDGKPGLILPPADPQQVYDSVHGYNITHGHNVSVIFSTYQALPKNIITCKKM